MLRSQPVVNRGGTIGRSMRSGSGDLAAAGRRRPVDEALLQLVFVQLEPETGRDLGGRIQTGLPQVAFARVISLLLLGSGFALLLKG
jgi:hypothetical protein